MKQITTWAKAIGITLGIIVALYAAWIIALLTIVAIIVFIVKLGIDESD